MALHFWHFPFLMVIFGHSVFLGLSVKHTVLHAIFDSIWIDIGSCGAYKCCGSFGSGTQWTSLFVFEFEKTTTGWEIWERKSTALDKHSNAHAAHGDNASDVESSSALGTHQTVPGAHTAPAARVLALISWLVLLGVARVLLGYSLFIGRRGALVLLHGWSSGLGLFQVSSDV